MAILERNARRLETTLLPPGFGTVYAEAGDDARHVKTDSSSWVFMLQVLTSECTGVDIMNCYESSQSSSCKLQASLSKEEFGRQKYFSLALLHATSSNYCLQSLSHHGDKL